MKSLNKNQKSLLIEFSEETKSKIKLVSNSIKGKKLFSDKIDLTRKSLSNIKSLPI